MWKGFPFPHSHQFLLLFIFLLIINLMNKMISHNDFVMHVLDDYYGSALFFLIPSMKPFSLGSIYQIYNVQIFCVGCFLICCLFPYPCSSLVLPVLNGLFILLFLVILRSDPKKALAHSNVLKCYYYFLLAISKIQVILLYLWSMLSWIEDKEERVHSSTCKYPLFPKSITKKTIVFPEHIHSIFIREQLAVTV